MSKREITLTPEQVKEVHRYETKRIKIGGKGELGYTLEIDIPDGPESDN